MKRNPLYSNNPLFEISKLTSYHYGATQSFRFYPRQLIDKRSLPKKIVELDCVQIHTMLITTSETCPNPMNKIAIALYVTV